MKDMTKLVEAVRSGQPTISVPEAGMLLGFGPDASYRQAREGIIPTIQIGRRRRVPAAKIMEMIGMTYETSEKG